RQGAGFAGRRRHQGAEEGRSRRAGRLRHVHGQQAQGSRRPQPADGRADRDQGAQGGALPSGQGTRGGHPVRARRGAIPSRDTSKGGVHAGGAALSASAPRLRRDQSTVNRAAPASTVSPGRTRTRVTRPSFGASNSFSI